MGSIAFDHATAQALINALESADERVHHQSMQWSDAVDTAMTEFEGGYARAFSSNADNERRDRSDLCFHLLTVASQVKFAQQDAEAEEQRLAAVAEWERNFAAWEADSTREGSVWTAVIDSEYRSLMWSQPSQTPTRQPNIQADVSVRDRQRTSAGGPGATSSASVDDLRAFVSTAESCNRLIADELANLQSAWTDFRSSCSWVVVETFTLLRALEQYLEHGELDARWISQIADAFEVAGTGELPNEVLNALAPALNNPAMTDHQLLQTLADTDAVGLAQLMKDSPALAHQLQLIAPSTISQWWHNIQTKHSADQQKALWKTLPEIFGNLEGVPYHIRHEANTIVLDGEISDLKSQLEDLAVERDEAIRNAGHSPNRPQSIFLSFSAREQDLQEQLDIYEQIQRSMEPEFGQAHRQLISLTADEPPLAAVSIGNLDTASNVTYSVAGMNSSTATFEDWTKSTENIHEEVTRDGANAATVAWIGYEAPVSPPASWGVFDNDMAEAGGENLANALRGFEATRSDDPQLNVVAHSYGTTTAAFAMSYPDVAIDKLVFAGSAGLPDHVTSANDLNADAVYAGHAQDVYPFIENGQGDQWAWVGRDFSSEHGVNPMNEDFAATTFGTDSEVEGAGDPVNTHSTRQKNQTGYYEAGSEAVVNIGRILRGEEEHVSEHIDKGLTTYQQSLLGPGAPYAP